MTVEARKRCDSCGVHCQVSEDRHGQAITFCPNCCLQRQTSEGVFFSLALTTETEGIQVKVRFHDFLQSLRYRERVTIAA